MTPHISAPIDAFAPDVLMPGDPVRARQIAHDRLDEPRLVSSVRGIEGYTGTWRGQPVSVMASGMGIPSICIYATELFRFYGVQRIIRVGTCGGLQPDSALGDIVVGAKVTTDSSINAMYGRPADEPIDPSADLLDRCLAVAGTVPAKVSAGLVHSSDLFYSPTDSADDLASAGVLAVEMEAAGLYRVAEHEQREALTIVTVSDVMHSGAAFTPVERETAVGAMVDLALATLSAE